MANPYKNISLSLAAIWLCYSPLLQASEVDLDSVRDAMISFKKSDIAAYAPKSIKLAEAYIAAALVAQEQQNSKDEITSVGQANSSLTVAKQTAQDYLEHYRQLITLRHHATTITKIVTPIEQSDVNHSGERARLILKKGNQAANQSIITHENGALNQTQQISAKAAASYQLLLKKYVPLLADMTENTLAKAAKAGAKKYAPELYQTATAQAYALRAYVDGISADLPAQPEQGLYLAQEAKHLSQLVKAWRKKPSSYEQIILTQRKFRYQLASIVGVESSSSNPLLSHIPTDIILATTQHTLLDERNNHKAERLLLKQQYRDQLAKQLSQLTHAQQNQMSNIKEAFNAKLERETYQQKRQQRLQALFTPKQVVILVNLDGSLLIRLSSLKFPSGRSKINSKNYAMLDQLKKGLAIYSDRQVRIEGHTDNNGEIKANQQLSLKRAESVRDFLIASGADGTHLKALGYGEVRPIAINDFEKGREMNRRIDVIIEAAKVEK
ncbi:MAG: OmpA family protein [Mariprofundus sp.]|nr:OmpA family protein [Mariprofundus sp.]